MNAHVEQSLFGGEHIREAWPFGDLKPFCWDLIMADPPWEFLTYSDKGAGKSASAQYQTMTTDEICNLPVGDLAAKNCMLWLWATAPRLPDAMKVISAWGFRYVTEGVWIKTTASGKLSWGTGYNLRSTHEPFLLASVGKPKTVNDMPSVLFGEAREHSRKPETAYPAAARLLAIKHRKPMLLDLFSRETRDGWQAWGNETGKFDKCDGGEMVVEPELIELENEGPIITARDLDLLEFAKRVGG